MADEMVSIDQLEDQLIDNPDAMTKQDLHDNSLDETFQKKLNARAEQLANQKISPDEVDANGDRKPSTNGLQFLVNKTELKYEYQDFGSLEKELNEWFVFNDLEVLKLNELSEKFGERVGEIDEADDGEHGEDGEIRHLSKCIEIIGQIDCIGYTDRDFDVSVCLDSLVYYTFGKFKECLTISEQINHIVENMKVVHSLGGFEAACKVIKEFISYRMDVDKGIVEENGIISDTDYFKALTIVYFTINCCLQSKDNRIFLQIRNQLKEIDLMSIIVEFIEHWKARLNASYRVRYLIFMLWKLMLLEFGDSDILQSCDEFLVTHHDIQNKYQSSETSTKLTCSPLEYFTFREDLLDKYPLFNDRTMLKSDAYEFKQFGKVLDEVNGESLSTSSSSSSIHENYNYFMAMNSQSSSLSNYIANPRPNKAHTVQSQLPAQTLHISTPVPSPPSVSSDFMSGGEKVRKSYQVNQAMPFIYPTTEEVEVPYAIKEANEILENSVYESYSNKRLWEERQKFMVQERGFLNSYGEDTDDNENRQNGDNRDDTPPSNIPHEFDYDEQELLQKYPHKKVEIGSLMRVEQFYSKNVEKLANLMQVLAGTIKTMKITQNLDFTEGVLNGLPPYVKDTKMADSERRKLIENALIQQLEVIHTKEITAKASSGIILMLLKWFKINHVLKYYYLTSILFDQMIFNVVIDYLRGSFDNLHIQKPKKDKENEYERLLYQNQLMNPQICLYNRHFFNVCLNKTKQMKYQLINTRKLTEFPTIIDSDNVSKTIIDQYNENFCFTMINVLNIVNKVLIKNYTQRILVINELKAYEIFKMLVINFDNKYLTLPILKIVKKLIPYQGRKWKSLNMGLISMIYMNCRLSLRDNWLSGKDLESDFNNSVDQEISLRGLLQFYNVRKYPERMASLGYEIQQPEFVMYPMDDE